MLHHDPGPCAPATYATLLGIAGRGRSWLRWENHYEDLWGDIRAYDIDASGQLVRGFHNAHYTQGISSLGFNVFGALDGHRALVDLDNPRIFQAIDYDQGAVSGPPFSVPTDELQELYATGWTLETLDVDENPTMPPKFEGTAASEIVHRLRASG